MKRGGKGSNIKGSSFENQIAKQLTAWGKGYWKFRRPGNKAAETVSGDIASYKESDEVRDFPFQIEARKNEKWTVENVLKLGKSSLLVKWMVDKEKISESNRPIMYVVTRNYVKPLVIMRKFKFNNLCLISDCPDCPVITLTFHERSWGTDDEKFVLLTFSDLLDWLDPASMAGVRGSGEK